MYGTDYDEFVFENAMKHDVRTVNRWDYRVGVKFWAVCSGHCNSFPKEPKSCRRFIAHPSHVHLVFGTSMGLLLSGLHRRSAN